LYVPPKLVKIFGKIWVSIITVVANNLWPTSN
jgi:hypothetical protein